MRVLKRSLAQLDRAQVSGAWCRGFESCTTGSNYFIKRFDKCIFTYMVGVSMVTQEAEGVALEKR